VKALRRTVSAVVVVAGLAVIALFWPHSLGGKVAYVRVDGHSMDPTYHMGDMAVVRKQSSYRVGDPVAYKIPKGEFGAGALVIHRLVGGNGSTGYVTKGDNKKVVDPWHPRTQDILGRVRFDVPGAGTRLAQLNKPVYLGGLVAGLTVLVMLLPSRKREEPEPKRRPRHAATPVGLVRRGARSHP
jgi:signal peptidase